MARLTIIETRKEIDLSIDAQFIGFSAIDANTYDASYEGEDENGHHWKTGAMGTGDTESEAIDSLIEKLVDNELSKS